MRLLILMLSLNSESATLLKLRNLQKASFLEKLLLTQKATVLSKETSVTLKDIQNIYYSWGKIYFEIHPMSKVLLSEDCLLSEILSDSYELEIEPDDIEVSDTLTVVLEIQ